MNAQAKHAALSAVSLPEFEEVAGRLALEETLAIDFEKLDSQGRAALVRRMLMNLSEEALQDVGVALYWIEFVRTEGLTDEPRQ